MSLLGVILTFWFVSFVDKNGSHEVALSTEALSLRFRHAIAIDSLDYAVSPAYLDSLKKKGVRICHTTRWLNGATIEATDDIAQDIRRFPFVTNVEATRLSTTDVAVPRRKMQVELTSDATDCHQQLEMMNLPLLHDRGYKGQGIKIAVLDGGFRNINTLDVFDSVRVNNQYIGAYDFADDEIDFYGEGTEHGSMCLALIAGNRDDYLGAANQAAFCVMRTEEVSTESPKEADNWVAAVEKCDSLGVNIVSTSLGYSVFDNAEWNYKYEQMDGRSCRASRAAVIAARKGMLLCTAAGNSAKTEWPWIDVPADADSTLTVGAVGRDSVLASFSSYGPSADGRIKPDVCALGVGTCLVNPNTGLLQNSNGTSFATPLIAGLAACLWSAFPDETNMQIMERIRMSSHLSRQPDNYYGYGIPNVRKAIEGQTDIVNMFEDKDTCVRKIFINGQVVIEREGIRYTVMGQKL